MDPCPGVLRAINQRLIELLERDRFERVEDAVGCLIIVGVSSPASILLRNVFAF
jgi:hypothetical protein